MSKEMGLWGPRIRFYGGKTMKTGNASIDIGRYEITDQKTMRQTYENDIVEAVRVKDFIFGILKHPVTITNLETGQTFDWRLS